MNILALLFHIWYTYIDSADNKLRERVWNDEGPHRDPTRCARCCTSLKKWATCCAEKINSCSASTGKALRSCKCGQWLFKTFVEPVWEDAEPDTSEAGRQDLSSPVPFK
jgi:hypothetical protein